MSCNDVQSFCRVGLPSEPCKTDHGRADLQSKTYVTPHNIIYSRPGATAVEFNGQHLRLPQKRTFLGPEMFNSGCATRYSSSQFTGGPNAATMDGKATDLMFQHMFSTDGEFDSNNVPPACVGIKCDGPNSALGWSAGKNGRPLWMNNASKSQPPCDCNGH